MNKQLLSAISIGIIALSSGAFAKEGYYLGIGGGANKVHDDEFEASGTSTQVEYDWGYAVTGSLGYQYDNGLRSEIELGYRHNSLDEIGAVGAGGHVGTSSAMLNVLYDFDISDTALDTYLGGGAGVARVNYDDVGVGGVNVLNDNDTVPAVQAIAGVSYAVADSTDLYLNYQYFHPINVDFRNNAGARVETDYDSSTILAGLKFNMYETPAPAPVEEPKVVERAPAPAPEPVSRTYLVFFDFDKSELTSEAMAVLNQAAEDARAGNAVAIKVVGHADRSGTDSYNMALSSRRANTVKRALGDLGIASGNVQTMAKGESDPLVPTEDGVREPQNRRAEIMYVVTPQR